MMKTQHIIGMIKELIIFPLAYVFSLFWFIPLKPKKKEGKPIVLIHGYLNSAFVWFYIKRKLEKQNLGPIYTINLGFPFLSLEKFAENLQSRLEKISNKTGHKTWIGVGHSMGGLVAALYAKDYAKEIKFSDIICMGSPFNGTKMNYLGFGKCVRQMAFEFPLLKDLHIWAENQNTITFKSISSGIDHIVVPYQSSQVGKEKIFLPNVGHGSLLFSGESVEHLTNWIKMIN